MWGSFFHTLLHSQEHECDSWVKSWPAPLQALAQVVSSRLKLRRLEQVWRFSKAPMTHSQLLEGFKCESKQKTMEEGRVGARSLAHNTLKGRRACQSSGMGLGRVDKLHSLRRAYTKPTQGGQCIVGTLLVLGRATGNMDTRDSPRPGLGGSHHHPPYSILCGWPLSPHPNGVLSCDSQVGVSKLPELGLP